MNVAPMREQALLVSESSEYGTIDAMHETVYAMKACAVTVCDDSFLVTEPGGDPICRLAANTKGDGAKDSVRCLGQGLFVESASAVSQMVSFDMEVEASAGLRALVDVATNRIVDALHRISWTVGFDIIRENKT